MPNSQQILEAIDARLTQAREQVVALEHARAALTAAPVAKRAGSRKAGLAGKPNRAPATATPSHEKAPVPVTPRAASVSRPRRSARAARTQPLADGAIENLLQENPKGLSATELIKLTGASRARMTARLHELEQAGYVRRWGARRTSRWRQVTDEDRIAERAAELEQAHTGAGSAVGEVRSLA